MLCGFGKYSFTHINIDVVFYKSDKYKLGISFLFISSLSRKQFFRSLLDWTVKNGVIFYSNSVLNFFYINSFIRAFTYSNQLSFFYKNMCIK